MKITKTDRLGRIVVPIQDRRALNLSEGCAVEIYRQGDKIVYHSTRRPAGYAVPK